MIAIPFSVVEKSIVYFNPRIQSYQNDLQKQLLKILTDKRLNPSKRKYVKTLLGISSNVITAKPSTLEKYRRTFDKIIDPKTMKSAAYKSFRIRIINALGYADRRRDFYPVYFQSIGIKACIYCNSMLTVTVERISGAKNKKSIQARFQVDHYLPKSEYPCFSISLYNLYPSCSSCNNVKSTSSVSFKLYEEGSKIRGSSFYFDLNMISVADYLLYRNNEMIIYNYKEPSAPKNNKTFQEVFAIQGIYDTQKDIAEELILKAEIYTSTYKDTLTKKYPKILTTSSITNRLLLGNYTNEKDIHKRPMAKFMIDIAKQVGLI
ncbi:hypothetical protein [Niastella sp. OAS944]|uniref:hypothetical protein n=1 Tax=Niastella sp. OAS944 TaxID=2664089 RepID=UPI00347839B8|nr:hypothetical protein [Chitinophagaceae bacterium OAS944]